MGSSHLAAEKALKALVIFRGVPLVRSHDLARLVQLLSSKDAKQFDRVDLASLNPWTIEGRYPADLMPPSPDEAADLLAAAERVVATARRAIDR